MLHTGHCLVDARYRLRHRGGEIADTVVHFADLGDDEIDAYVATGEPLKVAGAFTLDGLGGAFVRGIEGDPHTVVGIGLPLLREMFAEVGVRWTDLWRASRPPEHVAADGARGVGARDRRYSISAPAKTSVLNAPASATLAEAECGHRVGGPARTLPGPRVDQVPRVVVERVDGASNPPFRTSTLSAPATCPASYSSGVRTSRTV